MIVNEMNSRQDDLRRNKCDKMNSRQDKCDEMIINEVIIDEMNS